MSEADWARSIPPHRWQKLIVCRYQSDSHRRSAYSYSVARFLYHHISWIRNGLPLLVWCWSIFEMFSCVFLLSRLNVKTEIEVIHTVDTLSKTKPNTTISVTPDLILQFLFENKLVIQTKSYQLPVFCGAECSALKLKSCEFDHE